MWSNLRNRIPNSRTIEEWVIGNQNVLIILFTALYARLLVIGLSKDVWHDEAFQYLYSLKPVSFIVSGNDVHPPLYNLYTKFLVFIFGNDIVALRWAGAAAFSIGFVLVMYHLISDVFNERAGFWTAMLLSVTPTYLLYAVEFRSYSFALFFIALQMWAFHKCVKNAENKPFFSHPSNEQLLSAILYVIFSTVVLYTHYLTGLVIFVQILWVLGLRYRKVITDLSPFVVAYSAISILCLPLLYYLSLMLPKIGSFWFKDITVVSLFSTFGYLVTPPLKIPIGMTLFIYGLIAYGLYKLRTVMIREHFLFAMYVIIPVLAMWLISVTVLQFYHHRYFLFGGIGLFVIAGWVLARLGERESELDICMFVFYCLLAFFAFGKGFTDYMHHDIEDSARFLYNYTRNETDIATVHVSTFSQSPYKYYFPKTKHYLYTSLNETELFTAGGSVVEKDEVITDPNIVPNSNVYYVTHAENPQYKTIYKGDGIYVQKII